MPYNEPVEKLTAAIEEMGGIAVLAGWPEGDDSEGQALVVFKNRDTVRELYRLVRLQERTRKAIRRVGRLRVLAACVEVDSPDVEVWRVEAVGRLWESTTLGMGLLLSGAEAAAMRRGERIGDVRLEARDDGILLVKGSQRAAGGEGWAEIDLTALALEAG